MYDELVKRLRNRRICVQQLGTLNDYPLLGEAADAIEELQKAVLRLEEASGILDELPMVDQREPPKEE